ncbi:MAG: S9 family peptidase [Pirellulaceae bacterium]|nr:S9 family peptidase [Pirellulaceae bacterium]
MSLRCLRSLTISAGYIIILWQQNLATAQQPAPRNISDSQALRKVSDVTDQEDPYLWLEEVTGQAALDWVRQRNSVTQQKYETDHFHQLRDDLLAILDSDQRIPQVTKHGTYLYNFWRDNQHERGIWRRTTLEEYRQSQPKWELLLDLDQLAGSENENWVWHSATLLRPNYDRAIINLSRGGADATVSREFDLPSKSFVPDGFYRPEAKGGLDWINRDSVFVYTDFGAGSLTSSGYPRQAKLWRRDQPLAEAELVYEGLDGDMYISAVHDDTPGYERDFVSRTLAFYNNELYLRTDDRQLVKIEVPNSVIKTVFRDFLLLELREPWTVEGQNFQAGSLLVADLNEFLSGKRKFSILFQPTDNSSLASFACTRDYILLNILEDVKNRIYVLKPSGNQWQSSPLQGAPPMGTLEISPVDPVESNAYWMTASDFVTPNTLYYGDVDGLPEQLKQLPAQFDAANLQVTQHFVTSRDGTRVPYFMVADKQLALDGAHPTLLYGYGGFEISLTPLYNPAVGKAWCSGGGVFVVANIRGGGEYGPRWHQAALKQNRLRAYEDFAAVAQDLIQRGVTSSQRLGIQGGSNGGLLMGNMLANYPQLFSAVVCQVPLLDMRRYHLLLAGASWMAEYGNPDSPGEWEFIRTYSPYQQIRSDQNYPTVLFTTSTRDDRVHPGHARKMMALMETQGHKVWYYENIEGGHGGAANNKQRAYMQALAYMFLRDQLFPK